MAKVKFILEANKESRELDTVKNLNMDAGEWESMSEDDRMRIVEEWANEYIAFYYKDVK